LKQADVAEKPISKTAFLKRYARRLAGYTILLFGVFFILFVIDLSFEYYSYEQWTPSGWATHIWTMPVPAEVLLAFFLFSWVAGVAIILWHAWTQENGEAETARSKNGAGQAQTTRENLKKQISRRYQLRFWGLFAVYTFVLLAFVALVLVFKNSRLWYVEDPYYWILRILNELSPFAALALWLGGAAVLLFRQWRQSAGDIVGLIDSIEQMQVEPDNLNIAVPANLAEIRPVLQGIMANGQKSRQAAKAAEQRKNELIVYLAHDLKTPLTSVVGYLSLLEEAPEMPPEQKAKYTQIALEKAQRLESLINQFFEISRYNLHEMVLETEMFDLHLLLSQLIDEFYPLLESQHKTAALTAPEELMVAGDAGKLARVFNNILRNALAYSQTESEIRIVAEQAEEMADVTFTNEGRTIPAHQLEAIFEKFYRLDEARTSDTGGAGVGLAIAKEIVLLHEGDISAQSEDGVTIFTVTLPI
jgi:two-component system sensor histidine kinase VanS